MFIHKCNSFAFCCGRQILRFYAFFCKFLIKLEIRAIRKSVEYDIGYGEKYLVDGEILYPKGARHPIRAADTPRGLDPDMKTYRRREP